MHIEQGQFYKAKKEVNGIKTPGGYIYIAKINGEKIQFVVTEQPKKEALTGGIFTLNTTDAAGLEKIIEI